MAHNSANTKARQQTIGPTFFGQLLLFRLQVYSHATFSPFFTFVFYILDLHIQDSLVKTKRANGHEFTSPVPWQNSKMCVAVVLGRRFV